MGMAVPVLPVMVSQGKKIRKKVPRLPEPGDLSGCVGSGRDVIKLLCIGESTIAGVGVNSHREGFTGQLAAYLAKGKNTAVEWQVFAKSGLTAKTLAERIRKRDIEFEPDLVVVGIGGNDSFRLRSPARWRKDMQELIHLLTGRFADRPIVFLNMPPINFFPAFSRLVKFFCSNALELMRQELVEVVKAHPNVWFNQEKIESMDWGMNDRPIEDFFSDGIHPSALTYQLWAEVMAKYILHIVFSQRETTWVNAKQMS